MEMLKETQRNYDRYWKTILECISRLVLQYSDNYYIICTKGNMNLQ